MVYMYCTLLAARRCERGRGKGGEAALEGGGGTQDAPAAGGAGEAGGGGEGGEGAEEVAQNEDEGGGATRADPADDHQQPRHPHGPLHVGRRVRVAHQTGGGVHSQAVAALRRPRHHRARRYHLESAGKGTFHLLSSANLLQ